jgi:NAD(P)-dependent dehydrogenase (short-subunit alcohol dehydrogenase family)
MNTRPPRDISHAEQRSRSREDVPGGAARLSNGNVRVNAIAPGFIETDLARGIAAQEPDPKAAMRTRRAMHAIPRAGQPEEIGEAAAYLASDAASFMTGQCLTLDGGYTVR